MNCAMVGRCAALLLAVWTGIASPAIAAGASGRTVASQSRPPSIIAEEPVGRALAPVPESVAMGLAAVGLLGLGRWWRRRRLR